MSAFVYLVQTTRLVYAQGGGEAGPGCDEGEIKGLKDVWIK
jgi:hypothetical protein